MIAMPPQFRQDRTATGKAELIVTAECEWDDFPRIAQEVVSLFGMTPAKKIDGPNERLWIARLSDAEFCISWDIWRTEVSIMAWGDTAESELLQLVSGE